MNTADKIRKHGKEKYVRRARASKHKRFSIRTGDVVRELRLTGGAPAVCSALRSREFQRENDLRLVETSGPKSGLSTTVVYTYEFVDERGAGPANDDPWMRLRGALRDVFAQFGGGEEFLRKERENFYATREPE